MDGFQALSILAIVALAGGALLALLDGRLVLAGTLLVFVAFSIYLREVRERSTGP